MIIQEVKMTKYHKKIYFPQEHDKKLENFTQYLNTKKHFKFSNHAKTQFYNRVRDIKYFHDFLANINLKIDDIFEYKIENDNIVNAVYRIKYNKNADIIFSLTKDKLIITFYFNNDKDFHKTLNYKEYASQY